MEVTFRASDQAIKEAAEFYGITIEEVEDGIREYYAESGDYFVFKDELIYTILNQ